MQKNKRYQNIQAFLRCGEIGRWIHREGLIDQLSPPDGQIVRLVFSRGQSFHTVAKRLRMTSDEIRLRFIRAQRRIFQALVLNPPPPLPDRVRSPDEAHQLRMIRSLFLVDQHGERRFASEVADPNKREGKDDRD